MVKMRYNIIDNDFQFKYFQIKVGTRKKVTSQRYDVYFV